MVSQGDQFWGWRTQASSQDHNTKLQRVSRTSAYQAKVYHGSFAHSAPFDTRFQALFVHRDLYVFSDEGACSMLTCIQVTYSFCGEILKYCLMSARVCPTNYYHSSSGNIFYRTVPMLTPTYLRLSQSCPPPQVTSHRFPLLYLSLSPRVRIRTEGLDLNPQFTAVDSFRPGGDGGELQLFAKAGIKLVHGWVVDPESRAASVLSRVSDYDSAVMLIADADHLSKGRLLHPDSFRDPCEPGPSGSGSGSSSSQAESSSMAATSSQPIAGPSNHFHYEPCSPIEGYAEEDRHKIESGGFISCQRYRADPVTIPRPSSCYRTGISGFHQIPIDVLWAISACCDRGTGYLGGIIPKFTSLGVV